MAIQIQLRRDSAADWTSANPTLADGEIGYETDTGDIKIGDGSTAWISLGYFAGSGGGISSATASGTDTYTATISGVASYTLHDIYEIIFTNANTGSSTININSLGAKTLKKSVSTNLAASDISAGQSFFIVYDGTNFQVIGLSATSDWTTALVNAATSKTTPADNDETGILDSAASYVLKKLTWANLKATLVTYFDTIYVGITAANFGDFIVSLTGKTTPVDADTLTLSDSAASDDAKKLTWANLKATLKTYFDTLYTGGRTPSTIIEHYDDFIGTSTWFSFTGGGGSSSSMTSASAGSQTSAPNHMGLIHMTCGTTTTGYAFQRSSSLAALQVGAGEIVLEGMIIIDDLSDGTETFTFEFGISDKAANTFTDGCLIRYSHGLNGGKFQYISSNTSSFDAVDSGITVAADTWYKLKIVINAAATEATFTIDGAASQTITETLNTSTGHGVICGLTKSAGTTARTMKVDYLGLKVTVTTPR